MQCQEDYGDQAVIIEPSSSPRWSMITLYLLLTAVDICVQAFTRVRAKYAATFGGQKHSILVKTAESS